MKTVKRYDYIPQTSKTEITREGFLKVYARAARVGVLSYRQADGSIVRELVPPEELFQKDSMESLAMKPVTNNHPLSLLDSESAQAHTVGMTGENVKKDSDKFLEVLTVITDSKTIKDADGGKVEVSPGYVCELEWTPGKFDGQEYDAIQRNRRYNHLAIVKKGRNGPEVKLRLDADDGVSIELNKPKEGKKKMPQIKIGGKRFDVSDEVKAAMDEAKDMEEEAEEEEEKKKKKDAKKKEDAAEYLESEHKTALETLQAKLDGAESELKKLKEARTDSAAPKGEALRNAVAARIKLERVAASVGVEKYDELSDSDLKKAVIMLDSPESKLDGKSEEYIDARYDVASESVEASDAKAGEIGNRINKTTRTETMDAEKNRQAMITRQQNAWKKPAEKESA